MSNKINTSELSKSMRQQDVNETLRLLRTGGLKFFSWGGQAWMNLYNKFLRFKVNGHHHKGHVYISVNGSDLYNIYLTSTRGTVKEVIEDIYFEDLVDVIDNKIERVDEYVK
jgi:hypothetical protein